MKLFAASEPTSSTNAYPKSNNRKQATFTSRSIHFNDVWRLDYQITIILFKGFIQERVEDFLILLSKCYVLLAAKPMDEEEGRYDKDH